MQKRVFIKMKKIKLKIRALGTESSENVKNIGLMMIKRS
jgi:hypothetical protein